VSGATQPLFRLDEPDVSLPAPEFSCLGPGGLKLDMMEFGLDDPDPEPENIQELIARAYNFGRRANEFERQFCNFEPNNVRTTPLVFDTGASCGLTPYRADFLDDYREIDVDMRQVAGTDKIVGVGTTLRRYTMRCGQKVNNPGKGYRMPAADICLESPQSVISALGGVGKAILDGHNIEWHLPDGRIIDILP